MRGRERAVAVGIGLAAGIAVALPATASATTTAAATAAAANRRARVQGTFTMHAVVTEAIGVRGERRGERLTRTWRIRPAGCRREVCRTLHLRRTLSRGRTQPLSLHRRPDGTYAGQSSFLVALWCGGRVNPRGSRVRYTIDLRVTATHTVGGIRFARRIRATYVNPSRSDDTACSLQPSRDAARYTGRLAGGLPHPPRPAFTDAPGPGGLVQFTDVTRPGSGAGRRLRHWRWIFDDPASGAADRSRSEDALHRFTAPGVYRVTLTVTDAAGLSASATRSVEVPASAPAPQLTRRSAAWTARR